MVKTAYQKLCFYPLARVAVFGLLLSALLYQFHGLLSGGDELVARVLGWICLGFGALHGSLLAVGVIRYVIQVQRASRRLRSLPGYVRERLDQDLQTGDRINDLYFTSDFLLVYRLQFRRKQGFACIPYPEIVASASAQNGGKKTAGHFKPGRERLTYRDLFSGGKSGPGGGDRAEDPVPEVQDADGQRRRRRTVPAGPRLPGRR